MDIHERLKAQGYDLPAMPTAVAKYVPAVRSGSHIYVSGQLCTKDGQLLAEGPVPARVTVEEAQAAARQCVLNGLAAIDRALDGDWSKFVRVVRVGVYVNSEASFNEQHTVANGASELLGDVLGETGTHVRAAVGCISLPMNATVEAEMLVEAAE